MADIKFAITEHIGVLSEGSKGWTKEKRVSRNDRELKIDIREWPSDYTKMGKGITIVTVDVYGDNKGILIDGVPEMDEYIRKLLPERME